ncbi:hypothetical protein LJR255_002388 [Pararhizobium sp. LjRoot255]|uniref:hypothetical protein n=1 Tax=Pararhizobium sp. LjRoot255 TaxID=3342298 RepID=UPI003ECDDD56
MSRLNKTQFLGSTSYSLELERAKAEAFAAKHGQILSGFHTSLKASTPVARPNIVRLASPVWVVIGSNLLGAGVDADPVMSATYIDEKMKTFYCTFSLSYGSADDDVVKRMMVMLSLVLPDIASLLRELDMLLAAGADQTHPRVQEIAQELPELMLGVQHAVIAAAFGRIVDEDDIQSIPDEQSASCLH